jgi:hypothetical protein
MARVWCTDGGASWWSNRMLATGPNARKLSQAAGCVPPVKWILPNTLPVAELKTSLVRSAGSG